jgi:hypothetical protein
VRPLLTICAGLICTLAVRADDVSFNDDVRPILARNCFICHGPDEESRTAGLRLDTRDGATARRGRKAPAIVPGDAAGSLLIQRIAHADLDMRMPPANRDGLSPEDVETLRRWIDEGAAYEGPWAWEALDRVAPPDVPDPAWNEHPVDRFIHARLAAAGLEPAGPAGRAMLARRAWFDILGLPPTPEALDEFLADTHPDAWERLIDRLLDSPHYGERWARHWLDLVRYAETYGHEFDYPIRHAWQYRDYIVRSINADVPYHQFVTEHLAGDLLDAPRRHPELGYNESIIATGFWFMHQATHGPVDVRSDEAERIDNQIDVVSKSFLGLTVACARCHDHKFDPITTKDYYALAGFLQSSRRQEAYLDPGGRIAASRTALANNQSDAIRPLRQTLRTAGRREGARVASYLHGAREVLQGPARRTDDERPPIVFEDFEDGTYDGWTVEGTAFGASPRTLDSIAEYQGDLGAQGNRVVNTHESRSGEDGRAADQHTGTLTSATFTIERAGIEFLIGGGRHDGRTGIELLIDGHVVRSETGANSNRMREALFDVGEFVGQTARLRIIDRETGGWGNVGIDAITFTDGRHVRPVATVAADLGLDANLLQRWVTAIRGATPGTALEPWLVSVGLLSRPGPPPGGMVFADFQQGLDDWFVTGHAFDEQPADEFAIASNGVRWFSAGTANSGRLSDRLQGAIRSHTFDIEHDEVAYRVRGNGRIRLIIDGFVLDEFNALLFEGLTFNVNWPGWRWHRHSTQRYKGHRAHIEILDDGDGSIEVDAIRFVSGQNEPRGELPPAEAIAATFEDAVRSALTAGRGRAARNGGSLVEWMYANDLLETMPLLDATIAAHAALVEEVPAPMRVVAIADGSSEDERVFIRGNAHDLGDVVERRFLESLAGSSQARIRRGSGRLALAERLLDASNPLPARAAVNRTWHHLFGRGIVSTTDDFGGLGQPPTHPQLLNYLASWYRNEAGWSTKALIRLIMTSRTYRMSSSISNPAAERVDPDNRLLHRARVRRLQGEAIRDAILSVSGSLDPTVGGPPVDIHLTEFMTGRGRPGRSGPLDGNGRRSLYTAVRRNFLSPFMLAFDTPTPLSTIGRRNVSNVPAQSLILMNDPFVVQQAERWAQRILAEPGSTDERIDRMYESAIGRAASDAERATCRTFVEGAGGAASEDAWSELAHAMFNLKAFIFID